ncbi:MAG: phytanoyl-CoA dioxygenase family protein [Phycisphaeraceae bacterium]|nr:phytanoyl-CoA dioxygenase family protein [Phycisphaeraceae bacterium]
MNDFVQNIADRGFAACSHVIDPHAIAEMRESLPIVPSGGLRNALAISELLAALARADALRALARSVLGGTARVTRAILFDKSPNANWRVPWHQDTTIAVKERRDVPGFGPWSIKDGVVHVRPPASVLERVLTLRLHLDPCSETNGPLIVLPGTHRKGFLGEHESRVSIESIVPVTCAADVGDVVAFRPLLMHSSQKAQVATHRRVLHLEFAVGSPGGALEWNDADPDAPVSADR